MPKMKAFTIKGYHWACSLFFLLIRRRLKKGDDMQWQNTIGKSHY